MSRIVFIGAGPSAIYTLKELIQSPEPLQITMIEGKSLAGVGSPYDPAANDVAMLANIASVELPPVVDRLSDWLLLQDEPTLAGIGVDRDVINEFAFVPRIAIGAYYASQLEALVSCATQAGHSIDIRVNSRVVDVVEGPDSINLVIDDGEGLDTTISGNIVVIATGHSASQSSPNGVTIPAYPLELPPNTARRIGVLGTSLSAIDVVVGVASQYGEFDDDDKVWRPHADPSDKEPLSITMMSRRGLLPEADFYAPHPYVELSFFSLDELDCDGPNADSLLDRAFLLFKKEIEACDPGYAEDVRLHEATPDDIADRYFGGRMNSDPFVHAEANLGEAMEGHQNRRVCAWRYAILRMHEQFETLLPRLSIRDRARFNRGLKGLFIDNYAAVPHRSINRLLALRDAGVLAIERLSSDYQIDKIGDEIVVAGSRELRFDELYDARGERPRQAIDLPFPTLRLRLLAQSVRDDEADLSDATIAVDDCFALPFTLSSSGRIYVTAVPYMLHERPFSQGLTAARDIGVKVANAIIKVDTHLETAIDSQTELRALIDSPLLRDAIILVNGEVVLSGDS